MVIAQKRSSGRVLLRAVVYALPFVLIALAVGIVLMAAN
jgi:hypothetical protein